MDGYGNDTTASSNSDLAPAIASIFQSGVTAYVDSQAIQRGYTINNPQYYNAGYPGGVGTPYGPSPAGAPTQLTAPGALTSSSGGLLLIGLLIVGAVLLLKR